MPKKLSLNSISGSVIYKQKWYRQTAKMPLDLISENLILKNTLIFTNKIFSWKTSTHIFVSASALHGIIIQCLIVDTSELFFNRFRICMQCTTNGIPVADFLVVQFLLYK